MSITPLKIYSSLSKQKELFKPIHEGKVGMYVCGMTVYDYCHLGHARSFVAFDVVVRHLKAKGYEVNYVRNITDIDDKIIARANDNGEDFKALTARMITALHEDFDQLNLLRPVEEPKASDAIADMISMITLLIDKGHAYVGDNGDVFYSVESFEDYGKLSKKDIFGQQQGARVQVVDEKRNALDFVLWKQAKPGEPSWPSPWGEGRPGWHIECSVMSKNCLGANFDIHGGGFDLQFPHHENEIAQSEAANDKPFANYWMHVGFLQINHEKMSKSLGNFFTIRDVLKEYPAEVIRYFLISSHYRSQLNYSTDNLNNAHQALERLYQTLSTLNIHDEPIEPLKSPRVEAYFNAMDDDFNTPLALSVLFELSREINGLIKTDIDGAKALGRELRYLAANLGLLTQEPNAFLKGAVDEATAEKVEALIAERNQARADKDWQKADTIRDTLSSMGVEILDGKDGTTWRKQ